MSIVRLLLQAILFCAISMEFAASSADNPLPVPAATTVRYPNIEVLDYNDLVAGVDLTESIERAYGEHGPGLLTVKNVPGLSEARSQLLPLARSFALLDEDVKQKYENQESFYSFGWSHGKEKLQGNADVSKGSYYANPQYDEPETDVELIKKYPAFIHPNIWPREDLPELEPAFKKLGQLVVDVGVLVARQCDAYVKSRCMSYPANRLEKIITSSTCCKARLLHYFQRSPEEISVSDAASTDNFSSWCGWHNDHGSLTGLISAMFIDESGSAVENKDPLAGLYIRNRQSELLKVGIPSDHIAFQIGETAQIHSGGILQATPHAVRGSSLPGISRETFAVFMEPMYFEQMDCPVDVDASLAQSQTAAANLPAGVPPLGARWRKGMTFGDFTDATLSSYY